MCLHPNNIKSLILKVYYPQSDCICILFSHELMGLDKDILMAFVYIPPEGSSAYNVLEDRNGICSLEDSLSNIANNHDNPYIVCAGDFNARLGSKEDFIHDDSCS
jgi:hypothetical protein